MTLKYLPFRFKFNLKHFNVYDMVYKREQKHGNIILEFS